MTYDHCRDVVMTTGQPGNALIRIVIEAEPLWSVLDVFEQQLVIKVWRKLNAGVGGI